MSRSALLIALAAVVLSWGTVQHDTRNVETVVLYPGLNDNILSQH